MKESAEHCWLTRTKQICKFATEVFHFDKLCVQLADSELGQDFNRMDDKELVVGNKQSSISSMSRVCVLLFFLFYFTGCPWDAMLMLAGDSLYFPFFVQDSEQRTAVHICILKKMPEEFLASMDCWIVGVVLYSMVLCRRGIKADMSTFQPGKLSVLPSCCRLPFLLTCLDMFK